VGYCNIQKHRHDAKFPGSGDNLHRSSAREIRNTPIARLRRMFADLSAGLALTHQPIRVDDDSNLRIAA
jgi:hypothetical protein